MPGVEVAASWYGGSLHVVGLYVDHHNQVLRAMLDSIRQARESRNQRISEKLSAMGVPSAYEDACSVAGGEVVGRPHFAVALVNCGVADSIKDAFNRFLAKDGPAYVRRFLPMPREVIDTIHGAGGVAVWAHPLGGGRKSARRRFRQVVKRMKKIGIDSLEAAYTDYSPEACETVYKAALEYELLPSGGSDYHGENLPGIELGVGYGDLNVPGDWLEPIRERAAFWKRKAG